VLKDLFDHGRIFPARDHLDRTAAVLSGQDVDLDQIACSDVVERLEHYVRGAVTVGCFETLPNIPLSCQRQQFSRDRRAGDIAAQTFQLLAFVCLACHPGV
jgi:hypothetical protein